MGNGVSVLRGRAKSPAVGENRLEPIPLAPWEAGSLLEANTALFYVVKAAMEYSKSPKNPLQMFVGLISNVARLLNNIHPVVPLVLLALLVAAAGWGLLRLLA